MPVFPGRFKSVALGSVLAVGLMTATVNADIPDLELRWWINGNLAYDGTPSGTDNLNGTYSYGGSFFDTNTFATLSWDLTGDPDPQISGNLTVENPFMATIDVVLEVILPIAPSLPLGSEMLGSAAIGLTTDGGGGDMATLTDTPLWQGLLDGSPVGNSASLFFDPGGLSNSGFGSSGSNSNFGIPIPVTGPAVSDSIGIRISFSITQSDQASVTSVFRVTPIPGPSGLLVLAGGVLAIRRRRR